MKRVFLLLLLTCCLLVGAAAAAGGSGTSTDPYQISTASELQSIANNLAAHYILTADIDCSGRTWTSIGTRSAPFIGSLDGNGHQIKNLAITGANGGMFGFAGPGAVFRDIRFVSCTVSSTSNWVGVLCGAVYMSRSLSTQCQIINVDVEGCSVISSGHSVGGIVGVIHTSSNVKIESVTVNNTQVKSSVYAVGGIVGATRGGSTVYAHDMQVQNCIIESLGGNTVGGIIGGVTGSSGASSGTFENGVVENCVIKSATNYAGGVCGLLDKDNTNNIGSNLAISSVDVRDCTIYAATNYAGGITGRIITLCTGISADCAVSDCTIMANTYAAGICPAYS